MTLRLVLMSANRETIMMQQVFVPDDSDLAKYMKSQGVGMSAHLIAPSKQNSAKVQLTIVE